MVDFFERFFCFKEPDAFCETQLINHFIIIINSLMTKEENLFMQFNVTLNIDLLADSEVNTTLLETLKCSSRRRQNDVKC